MFRIFFIPFLICVIGISGCAISMSKPPSQYSFPMTGLNNLSQPELSLIFTEVFSETYKEKPFVKHNYNGNPYYDRAAVVRGRTITYRAMNANFGHYFYVENGRVVRQDITEEQLGDRKGEAAYCMLCDDKGFTEYIEDFQIRLSSNLSKKIIALKANNMNTPKNSYPEINKLDDYRARVNLSDLGYGIEEVKKELSFNGGDCLRNDNNKCAFEPHLERAKIGSVEDQFFLGFIYYLGSGVVRDFGKSFYWYRQAANNGHPTAMVTLAHLYEEGLGVERNYAEAMAWYKKVNLDNHPSAQLRLGLMYHEGKGVEVNQVEAFLWIKRAAENGNIEAQERLGQRYANGLGVKQDHGKAVYWFAQSAKTGNENTSDIAKTFAMKLKDVKVVNGNAAIHEMPNIDRRTTFDLQINTVLYVLESEDPNWYQVYEPTKNLIGYVKSNDISEKTERYYQDLDYKRAIDFVSSGEDAKANELLDRLVEGGHAVSELYLGRLFHFGKEFSKALYWYDRSSKSGEPKGTLATGLMYMHGEGVEKNHQKAFTLLKSAADRGVSSAQVAIATAYMEEAVTEVNPSNAYYYLMLAQKDNVDDNPSSLIRKLCERFPTESFCQ